MKSVKNDTKYIIKRILIGVGIAIILFNLKKCNVYADSLQHRTFCNNNNNATSTWTYYNEDINCSQRTYNNNNETFTYNGYKYNIGWYNSQNADKPLLIVFEYNGEPYVTYGNISTIPTGDNWYINIISTQMQSGIAIKKTGESNISYTTGFLPYFSNHYYVNGSSTQTGIVYTNVNTDSNINFNNVSQISPSFFLEHYEDLHMIYNTYNLPVYVNGNYEVPEVPNSLANLTQVDLTGYEGALIVPKSYEVMNEDYSSTQEVAPGVFHTNLNLSFYTQYCTRQTLVNLTNVKNLYTNNIGVSTGSLSASISGTCPTEPTETIMSYQYDMYSGMIPMGILLYNNEINENGSFGTSYFWYDDDVYDIYMIESLDNFSANISFTDYDGTEKDLNIEGLPTFLEMAEYALANDTDLNKNRTNSLFSFIQAPFSFLNLIKTTKCTALRFPFPNSNQIIIIPCMSETYERIGGNLIYTISIIINGLIIYRCIITMIKVTECMLDADDDKLEVLEL